MPTTTAAALGRCSRFYCDRCGRVNILVASAYLRFPRRFEELGIAALLSFMVNSR